MIAATASTERRFSLAALLIATLVVVWAVLPIVVAPRLEPDDYRYLDLLSRLAGPGPLLATLTVENRWDHLWWSDAGGVVRFFRPTVVLSYALDQALWGSAFLTGLFVTNTLLVLACVVLVHALLRLLGVRGWSGLLATVLFAAFACHGEALRYVAGRTDSLAAAAFLAALVMHLWGDGRGWACSLGSSTALAFALLTKELTVVLPIVCFAADVLVGAGPLRSVLRRRAPSWVGFAAVIAAYLWLRQTAAPGGTQWVFPYLVHPGSPAFAGHLWTTLRSHGENLFAAGDSPPFLQLSGLAEATSPWRLGVSLLMLLAMVASLSDARVGRRAAFALVLGTLTWLPTSVVYVSERYLFLPSVALAIAAGLAMDRWNARRGTRWLAWAVCAVWGAHQAFALRAEVVLAAEQPSEAELLERIMVDARRGIPHGARILLLDFPLDWLAAQFAEPILRVQLGDPSLEVRVLTHFPEGTYSLPSLERRSARGLRISRGSSLVHPLFDGDLFPRTNCTPPRRIDREVVGFTVDVVAGRGNDCTAIEVGLPRSLEDYTLLWFSPAPGELGAGSGPLDLGRFQVVEPPPL